MPALSHVVIEAVRERAESNEKIDRSQLESLFECMADLLSALGSEPNYDTCLDQVDELAQYISSCYASGAYRKRGVERAFELGAVFGACCLFDSVECEEERKAVDNLRIAAVSKYRPILMIVRDNPGITHGDLAKRCDKSKSMLSQIMASIRDYRLFTASTLGKTKHYYLSHDAERLLANLREGADFDGGLERVLPASEKADYVVVPRDVVPARKASLIGRLGPGAYSNRASFKLHMQHESEELSFEVGAVKAEVKRKRDSFSVDICERRDEVPSKPYFEVLEALGAGAFNRSGKPALFDSSDVMWTIPMSSRAVRERVFAGRK